MIRRNNTLSSTLWFRRSSRTSTITSRWNSSPSSFTTIATTSMSTTSSTKTTTFRHHRFRQQCQNNNNDNSETPSWLLQHNNNNNNHSGILSRSISSWSQQPKSHHLVRSSSSFIERRHYFSSSPSCRLSETYHNANHNNKTIPEKQKQTQRSKFHREYMRPYPNAARQAWSHDIPKHIQRPPYAMNGGIVPYSPLSERVHYHDEEMIHKLRHAAQCASNALYYTTHALLHPNQHIQDGHMTTNALDQLVHEYIIHELQCYPSPLLYASFPKSICTSINEIICHGIPDDRPIQYGDVISIDISLYTQNGVHGDNCATVIVGDYDDNGYHQNRNDNDLPKDWRGIPHKSQFDTLEEQEHYTNGRRLMQATLDGLYAGIEQCYPGNTISAIGNAIHDVADQYHYSSIQRYRGHGISSIFHTAPYISHCRNAIHADDDIILKPGMIFTIEPMFVNAIDVGYDCYEWDSDHWTVSCNNPNLLSCQFEHTVYINNDVGVEILTRPTYHPEIQTLPHDHRIVRPRPGATYY